MLKFKRVLGVCLAAVILSVPFVHGQTSTASVNGTVTDSGGAIIPDATVTITNTSTGIVTAATTNAKGFYNFPELQIGGPYTVEVDALNFKKFESTGLMLQLNDNRSIDAKLEVGTASQTVEVSATNSAVETTDTQLKDTISASEIEELPLFGRDATGLQKLQAGSVEASDRFGTYCANGSQSQANSFLLDGIDINDGPLQTQGLSINPDALAQETIITSTLNPEFARNSGAVVNETIKSGTNQFHGSAYEFYRDKFLNNGNYFSLTRPPFHQNLYGATLGGPLLKDKLFGFIAYQGFRNNVGTTEITVVPSAQERAGIFPAIPASSNGPAVNAVTILPSQFNPIALKLLNQYVPLPNTTSGGFPAYGFAAGDTAAEDQGIIRLDYHLSQKDAFFASTTFQSDPDVNSLPFLGSTLPGFAEVNARHYKLFSADYTRTLNPNMLNDLSASYYRFNFADVEPQQIVTPQSYGFNIVSQIHESSLPFVNVSGFFNLGFSPDGPQPRIDTNLRGADPFTWVTGNHTLKFGASVEQFRVSSPFYANINGNFSFSPDANNPNNVYFSLENFLTGVPSAYGQDSGGFNDALAYEGYLYAQDSWKASSDLVLNYGLAMDIEAPQKNTQFYGLDVGCFSISIATTSVFKGADAPPGLLYPGDPGCNSYGGATIKYDHFAPRLGFDWSPSVGPSMLLGRPGANDFSIRAGIGIYYNRDAEEGSLQNIGTPPFQQIANVAAPASFSDPLGVGSGKNPFPFTPPAKGAAVNWPSAVALDDGLDINVISPNYSVPYVYNFNFNLQRELPGNVRVQAGYVGSVGHRLVLTYESDPITPAGHAACVTDVNGCGAPGQIFTHLLYPQYAAQPALVPGGGGIPYYESVGTQGTEGSSNYSSAQVTVTKAPTHGLSFTAAYTYSKALDNGSGIESSGFNGRGYNQYPGYQQLNYGPSDYDARQRLVGSYVYRVPLYHSSNYLLREGLSGWEVSGITAIQGGNPVNITEAGVYLSKWCDAFGYYFCPDNPNVSKTSIAKFNPRSSSHQFFDSTPFSSETLGTFGNTQRGIVVGPGFNYTNLSFSKNFPIGEDGVRSVQLRMDIANAFNHANFAQPDGNYGDPTFGVVSSVRESNDPNGDPSPGRAIQLVGKFYF
jgi:hypothetical protein